MLYITKNQYLANVEKYAQQDRIALDRVAKKYFRAKLHPAIRRHNAHAYMFPVRVFASEICDYISKHHPKLHQIVNDKTKGTFVMTCIGAYVQKCGYDVSFNPQTGDMFVLFKKEKELPVAPPIVVQMKGVL